MHRRTRAKDDPELAWGLLEWGQALAKQEKYADAEKQFKEALTIFRKHNPNDLHKGPQFVLFELLWVLRAQNKQSEADDLQRQSVQRLLGQQKRLPDDPDTRQQVGHFLWELAAAEARRGRPQEAEQAYRDALTVYEKLVADFPDVADHRWHLAGGWEALAGVLKQRGHVDEAEKAFRTAVAIWDKLVTDFPRVGDYRWHLAVSWEL